MRSWSERAKERFERDRFLPTLVLTNIFGCVTLIIKVDRSLLDIALILLGEILSWSLMGVVGLK